jgi:hypothetical protein
MTKIYADTKVCQWHIKQWYDNSIEILDDLNGADSAIFHIPYPLEDSREFRNKLNLAVKNCDTIAVLISELHQDSVDFFIHHQHTKVIYFVCGAVENIPSKYWMDWFVTTCTAYKNNSNLLSALNPYAIKPKLFDILLGRQKPHRSTVYNFIKNNNLDDHVVMTYLKGQDNIPLQAQDESGWLWEPGIIQLKDEFQWTITPIRYQGRSMSLSQVVPTSIYNQTAYSVVAETNYDNHYSFYTEKIVKPILAERLFIVFSGQHYLHNLRSLGFKTFDGIVDETYDSIADNDQRFKLACEQIQYLINQPQEEILAKIRPITEHNKQVMLDTDWYGNFSKELRAVLLDHTRQN